MLRDNVNVFTFQIHSLRSRLIVVVVRTVCFRWLQPPDSPLTTRPFANQWLAGCLPVLLRVSGFFYYLDNIRRCCCCSAAAFSSSHAVIYFTTSVHSVHTTRIHHHHQTFLGARMMIESCRGSKWIIFRPALMLMNGHPTSWSFFFCVAKKSFEN